MAGLFGSLGGSTLGEVLVRVGIDTKQLNAGMAQARASADAGGKSLSKFGAAAQAATAVAAVAFVAFAKVAVEAASDEAEAINKVGEVFGESADAVEAFADTTATSLGIAKTAALEAAANFGLLFESAGKTEEAAAAMSKQFVTLSADLASFFNVSTGTALEKLRAGLAGQSRPLREFGVFISAARVESEAYASGIAEVGAELTDAQKVQARYNIILQDTTKAQGDFARTSDGLANQQRIMSAQWDDLKAKVGVELLPVMKELVHTANDLIPVLGPLLAGAMKGAAAAAQELLNVLKPVLDALDAIPHKTEGAAESGSGLADVWATLIKFNPLHILSEYNKKVLELTGVTKSVGIETAKYTGELITLDSLFPDVTASTEGLTEAQKKQKESAKAAKQATRDLAASLTLQLDSLGTVKRAWELNSQAAVRGSGIIADKQKTIAADIGKLDKLEIGKGLKNQLLALGPDMVHAFIKGNAGQREKIIANLKVYNEAVKATLVVVTRIANKGGQTVGGAMGDGLALGIGQKTPAITAAATAAVNEAIAAARAAADAQSPSRKMMALGRDLIDGLVEGMQQRGDVLEKAFNKIAKRFERIQEQLKEFKDSIRSGFDQLGDLGSVVTGLFGQTDAEGNPVQVTAQAIASSVQAQVQQAQKLAEDLKAAAAAGLSQDLLSQFAGQGASAIPALEELLANPELISQLNAANEAIAKAAGSTANALGEQFFGKAIARAQEHLERLSERIQDFIDKLKTASGDLLDALRPLIQELQGTLRDAPRTGPPNRGPFGNNNNGNGDRPSGGGHNHESPPIIVIEAGIHKDRMFQVIQGGLLELQSRDGSTAVRT